MLKIKLGKTEREFEDPELEEKLKKVVELKKEANRVLSKLNPLKESIGEKAFDYLSTQKSVTFKIGEDSVKISYSDKITIQDVDGVRQELGDKFDNFVSTKFSPRLGFANHITPNSNMSKYVSVKTPAPTVEFILK
jgi:hypothetical protein